MPGRNRATIDCISCEHSVTVFGDLLLVVFNFSWASWRERHGSHLTLKLLFSGYHFALVHSSTTMLRIFFFFVVYSIGRRTGSSSEDIDTGSRLGCIGGGWGISHANGVHRRRRCPVTLYGLCTCRGSVRVEPSRILAATDSTGPEKAFGSTITSRLVDGNQLR